LSNPWPSIDSAITGAGTSDRKEIPLLADELPTRKKKHTGEHTRYMPKDSTLSQERRKRELTLTSPAMQSPEKKWSKTSHTLSLLSHPPRTENSRERVGTTKSLRVSKRPTDLT